MVKNVLLECDSFTVGELKKWLTESKYDENFKIFVLVKIDHIEKFKEALSNFENLECICYGDIFTYESENKLETNTYYNFVDYYLKDHITARLIDRDGYLPDYGIGVQNAFHYLSDAAHHTLLFLKDHDFLFLYFRESPHISKEWLLAKSAEFLSITIYISEQFVFTWLFTLKKGFQKERETVLENLDVDAKSRLRKDLTNYIKIVSDKYEVAIPSYEKERLGQSYFKFYNPFREILRSLKRPHRFYNKTKNYFFYKEHVREINLENTHYFVFFMQYQPERSSLPEGYEFSDQFYAIRVLSMLLPDNVKLIVKEHPSMFTYESEPKFRSIYNYKSLLKLKNVVLCSLNINSFKLIDNAMAVATITGTSAIEAYIRKTPVIVFGRNNLNVDGVHGFKTVNELSAYINLVCDNKIIIDNVVENLFNLCYKTTISGIPKDTTEEIDYYHYKKDFQENAHYKLLSKVLNYHIS